MNNATLAKIFYEMADILFAEIRPPFINRGAGAVAYFFNWKQATGNSLIYLDKYAFFIAVDEILNHG